MLDRETRHLTLQYVQTALKNDDEIKKIELLKTGKDAKWIVAIARDDSRSFD